VQKNNNALIICREALCVVGKVMQFAFYRCELLSPENQTLTKFINRFMELDKFTAMETYTAIF